MYAFSLLYIWKMIQTKDFIVYITTAVQIMPLYPDLNKVLR